MHSHDDYKVTNFGEYPGGQLSIIHVNGFAAPAAEEDEGNTDTIQSSPGGISEIGR
jgi:hypothetical protein